MEAVVDQDGKSEAPSVVVDGLVVELQHLEACERGLAEAYDTYERVAEQGPGVGHLSERHRRHAAWLASRLRAMGAATLPAGDDEWLTGPPDQLRNLIYGEHAATRTYHDHLTDFDPETLRLIRNHILPEQEQTLAELTGEEAPAGFSMEP
jgi:hypothetical protein